MRVQEVLIVGGALIIIPLGMGGIPLVKLLFFALAALIGATTLVLHHQTVVDVCGTGQRSLARQIRTVSVGAPRCPVPHYVVFLCTFFAVVFLSPLWSAAPFLSVVGVEPRFEGVMAYVVYAGLVFAAWGIVRSGREHTLLSGILWSNAGVVLYGLVQAVGLDPFNGWWEADVFLGRAFSTVGQPNMLGQFLLLTGPLAVWTVWRWEGSSLSQWERATRPNDRRRPVGRGVRGCPLAAVTLFMGNILVLFATGSRAGVLGALVVMVIILWLLRTRERNPWGGIHSLKERVKGVPPSPFAKGEGQGERVSRAGFPYRYSALSPVPSPTAVGEGGLCCERGRYLLLSISLVIAVMVSGFLVGARRFSLPGEWDRSLHGRLAIWRDAVTMIRERPQGWGLETTGLLFPRFQSSPLTAYESLTTSVDRAHSKPLDLFLTVGVLGLLSYYAFLTTLLFQCLLAWRRRGDALALVGVISLVGTSVSFLFGFEGITVHAFFWLVCGMLLWSMCNPHPNPLPWEGRGDFPPPFKGEGEGEGLRKCPLWAHSVVIMLMILLFMVITLTTLSLSSRVTAHRAEQAFQSGNLVAAVQEYDRAVRRVPWDRALLIRFLETSLLAREWAEDVETEDLLDASITRRLQYLDRLTSNEDPLLPSLEAWHAAMRGEKEEALGFLEEANTRAPFSIPRLRIAMKVARLLNDRVLEETLHTELLGLLPPWWNDPQDPRHWILLKENSWLEDMVRSSVP